MRAQASLEDFLFHDLEKTPLVAMLLLLLPVVDCLPMPTRSAKERDDAPMRVFCIIMACCLLSIYVMLVLYRIVL